MRGERESKKQQVNKENTHVQSATGILLNPSPVFVCCSFSCSCWLSYFYRFCCFHLFLLSFPSLSLLRPYLLYALFPPALPSLAAAPFPFPFPFPSASPPALPPLLPLFLLTAAAAAIATPRPGETGVTNVQNSSIVALVSGGTICTLAAAVFSYLTLKYMLENSRGVIQGMLMGVYPFPPSPTTTTTTHISMCMCVCVCVCMSTITTNNNKRHHPDNRRMRPIQRPKYRMQLKIPQGILPPKQLSTSFTFNLIILGCIIQYTLTPLSLHQDRPYLCGARQRL